MAVILAKMRRRSACAAFLLAACAPAAAEGPAQITVGKLIADGWEIAGYAPLMAMVGSVILFKHKDREYFVQCSAVYDATRGQGNAQRVVTNCYEIR